MKPQILTPKVLTYRPWIWVGEDRFGVVFYGGEEARLGVEELSRRHLEPFATDTALVYPQFSIKLNLVKQ